MRKFVLSLVSAALLLVGGYVVVSSAFDHALLEMKSGNFEKARPSLELLAMLGHSRAQFLVGEIYAYGWGVTRNRDVAIKWFRRAAYKSEGMRDSAAYAAHYVAQNFAQGYSVNADPGEAAWWLQLSIDGGFVENDKATNRP